MRAEATTQFDHNSTSFIADPYPQYEQLRDEDPVHFSERYGGYFILTRYEDVRKALLDWKLYSSAQPGVTSIPMSVQRDFPEIPLEVDPTEHTEYRGLVTRFFTRNAISELEADIRRIAVELLEPLREARGGDFVQEFALPLVSRVLAVFLQVPEEDAKRWVKWAKDIFHGRLTDRAQADRASRDMIAYVDGLVEDRRRSPGDDLFSALVTSRFQGRPLTQAELHGFGVLLLNAGQETTVNGIGNSLWYLAEHSKDRRRLQEEPGLLPAAVEEFLRFMSPIQLLGRNATQDTTLHGRTIPAEATVAVCYGSANRDTRVFPAADECRIDRHPNPHLAFGAGPHACLGAHLARAEMRVALEEIFARMPDYRIGSAAEVKLTPHGDLRGFWRLPVSTP
ncbi:MAG: cytochrome P450 [Pseudonocardiaceae bacterium]|nr:cytochrome P450 [Pseudonocardiaceae bacterium]